MRRLICVLLLAGCSAPGAPSDAPLEVGAAEIDITPPIGYRMAGYYNERRNTGVKDPLMAKALYFRQGDTTAVLVFCDLIGVPAAVASKARVAIASELRSAFGQVGIAATHSHTGPLFYGMMKNLLDERAPEGENPYPEFLVARLTEVALQASRAARPVELRVGAAEERGLSYNRRFHMKDGSVRTNPGSLNPDIVNAAGPIDPAVPIVLVADDRGPAAALTVFACHCDTVGGTEFSADYPGFLARELRASMGERFVSAFGAGTCGNINHIDVSRKERRTAHEIGVTLGQDVLSAIPKLRPIRPALAMETVRVDLPRQMRTPEQVAYARSHVGKVGSKDLPFLDQVRIVTTLHLEELPAKMILNVQVLRLSRDAAVVLLPGEIFVEHGLAIKARSPFATTIVVELANDACAYVPTREAFAQGAYEVENSRLAPGGGEALVDEAVRLLHGLADAKP
jgi:hypothetical protein